MEHCPGSDCPKKKTVHLTEIIDGKMTEMHLCDDCPKLKKVHMDQQFGLAGMLADFADFGEESVEKKSRTELYCDHCGLEYEEFRKAGRLGCAHCYAHFAKPMSVLLKNIHGSNTHRGKAPAVIHTYKAKDIIEKQHRGDDGSKQTPKPSKEELIRGLKQQLEQAVERQDFEQAALLRDQIQDLEKNQE